MIAPWFDPNRFGALYGGIGGGLLGGLAGILGGVTGMLAPKGKGRSFILGAFTFLILVGLVHLAVGLYALWAGQSWGIWYPLVLIGFILAFVLSVVRPVVRNRYVEVEMRKMDAAAFRRG